MKQDVEIGARLGGVAQAIQTLDEIPERIGIEHEPGAGHDVGPVTRLVLLEKEEALVLLREQPLEGELDALGVTLAEAAARVAATRSAVGTGACAASRRARRARVEIRQRDQPPQRRVDAT